MTRTEMIEDTARRLFAQAWALALTGKGDPGAVFIKLRESHLPEQFKAEVLQRVLDLTENAKKGALNDA